MYGSRHFQFFLTFTCFFIAYLMRLDITIAIVAMTDRSAANMDFPVNIKKKQQ